MLLSVWLLTGESTCMDDIPLFAEMREIVAILIDSTERIMVIIGVLLQRRICDLSDIPIYTEHCNKILYR